jgi:predicted DNA-binding ribbon-helix-helix protein
MGARRHDWPHLHDNDAGKGRQASPSGLRAARGAGKGENMGATPCRRNEADCANSTFLDRMFSLCQPEQGREYQPERRSIRVHGHCTTIRLERAFWSVLEELAASEGGTVGALITRIHDHCLSANDKNLASCLRVVCLKYVNTSG